jgi:hypothetical protein
MTRRSALQAQGLVVTLVATLLVLPLVSTVPGASCAADQDRRHDLGGVVFLQSVLAAADLGSRVAATQAAQVLDIGIRAFADYTGMDETRPESAPLPDPELEEVIGAGVPTPYPTPTPHPPPTALPG